MCFNIHFFKDNRVPLSHSSLSRSLSLSLSRSRSLSDSLSLSLSLALTLAISLGLSLSLPRSLSLSLALSRALPLPSSLSLLSIIPLLFPILLHTFPFLPSFLPPSPPRSLCDKFSQDTTRLVWFTLLVTDKTRLRLISNRRIITRVSVF